VTKLRLFFWGALADMAGAVRRFCIRRRLQACGCGLCRLTLVLVRPAMVPARRSCDQPRAEVN
jgi:hypothetical protein